MYTNLAYLGSAHENIVDQTKPLLITAVGNYRVHTSPVIGTYRPKGRDDYQLLYIVSGKGHFYFDGKETIIPKGNMLLFRPKEIQIYDLLAVDKAETYWVHFTGFDVESTLKRCNIPADQTVIHVGMSTDYGWIYRQMIHELQLRRPGYEEILQTYFLQILLYMGRYLQENNAMGTDSLNEIERAIHYFHDNYNQEIVINDYAAQRQMSACWFIKNFKLITRMTPTQYLIQLRMSNAMTLLEATNQPVSKIALMVGYNNVTYFHRLFLKHTGMTPLEFRRSKTVILPDSD